MNCPCIYPKGRGCLVFSQMGCKNSRGVIETGPCSLPPGCLPVAAFSRMQQEAKISFHLSTAVSPELLFHVSSRHLGVSLLGSDWFACPNVDQSLPRAMQGSDWPLRSCLFSPVPASGLVRVTLQDQPQERGHLSRKMGSNDQMLGKQNQQMPSLTRSHS